ncbi:MAG: SPOR domain-containing protein [Gammaproteobacteria bacterium]|nr:MAG: SPOR domain-containing protein [Gammaproteobacteria bacterium]
MARKRKRSTAKSSSIIPAWIWLTLGILIGLGIAMFTGSNVGNVEQVTTSSQSKVTKEPETKRKFDFYTLLPELEIVIPLEESQPPKQKPSASPDTTNKQQTNYRGGYLLQAGSFQQFNEADSLKARLALIGVEANIQSVEVNKTKWHRVQIGPSNDRNALEKLRKRLKSSQIDTILLQAKK